MQDMFITREKGSIQPRARAAKAYDAHAMDPPSALKMPSSEPSSLSSTSTLKMAMARAKMIL